MSGQPNFAVTASQTGTVGSAFVNEVFFRTGGRLPRSSGLGFDDLSATTSANPLFVGTTCIAYINKAYALIEAAATYVWDVTTANVAFGQVTVSSVGQIDLSNLTPFPLYQQPDIGANFEFTNLNGLPIMRVPLESSLQGQSGQFVNVNTSLYNNWYLLRASALQLEPGVIQFTPGIAGTVNMLYSRLPLLLTDGFASGQTNEASVPWLSRFMDDLLVEWAEMMIKRTLNFAGWQDSEQRCLKKLQDAKTMFSAQRKSTGPVEEAQLGASKQ